MSRRKLLQVLLVATWGLVPGARTWGDEAPLHEVSQEVQALRTLRQLKFTPEQMKALEKLARETAQPARTHAKPKASAEYAQTLADLREALASDDADRADDLDEKLDQLTESEKPEVDDGVELTAAARKSVPEVLRALKPAQLAAFFGDNADEVIDPQERLLATLDAVRALKGNAWKEKRDEVAEEVARALAGVDADRAERVHDQVVALLSKAHSLTDDEFNTRRTNLDKTARQIAGNVGPVEVLQHQAEYALAELLSNPRLAVVLKELLK